VQRLVEHDPALLNAKTGGGWTPLMWASRDGHEGVVRWLLDKGAAMDAQDNIEHTSLWLASWRGRTPVVRLLLERGADPTIADYMGLPPLLIASDRGHLEVVRLLLGHPSAKSIINHRDNHGRTALWWACSSGCGGVARALLESGADLTIAASDGTTPTAIAKQDADGDNSPEGRRECVAALEVRSYLSPVPQHLLSSDAWGVVLSWHDG
jgi:ankyrin repeat protein